jgi:hypothetical protein
MTFAEKLKLQENQSSEEVPEQVQEQVEELAKDLRKLELESLGKKR